MSFSELYVRFIEGIQSTGTLEYIVVIVGIASVCFSNIENVLVYPVGLINTIIYIYLSIINQLPGEASVNFYYTVMSFYGWWLWLKKDKHHRKLVQVSYSDSHMWLNQLLFFLFFYVAIYFSLVYLKKEFFEGAIPWADALASSTAFTGMWLMTRKKVESWYWWIATNFASIPLYFVKGLVFTSVYYVILLVMAVFGLIEWRRRARVS